jgi:serine/threonine-protein kinase RsbW
MHTGEAAAVVPATRELAPESSWLLRYMRSYPGREDQLRNVRAFLREVLAGRPRVDDAVAIGSELAANACLHSRSGGPGGMFTVRAEVSEGDYLCVTVEDAGGPWDPHTRGVVPEHGLDLVEAIAGRGRWGINGNAVGRAVWAWLAWPGSEQLADHPIQAGAECYWTDDEIAEMGRRAGDLARALAARGLGADIVSRIGRPPYLDVYAPQKPELTQRVYSQLDWCYWPTAERIAASDDVATAVDVIACRLHDGEGPAGA